MATNSSKYPMERSKLHFEKLTPIDNAKIDTYLEALDFVFENKDIKNIAITGPYGAGKSSVLESYKKGRKWSFIHISLAHFEAACESKSESIIEGSKKSEVLLEGKILNQLLHQIPPDRIPQSHFKTKTKISRCNILKISIAVLLAIWLTVYFFNFSSICQWVEKSCWESGFSSALSTTYSYSVPLGSIFLAGYLIYSLVYVQKSKLFFRKITLYGSEIEIFEHNTESFFDKYLNEVLYLFENAGADVVVFEDMDRFNYNQIFEKLREINYLVNKKQTNHTIRFFYLLRDDIFTSKDRTKFFDFIIPVVPVIDNSNSYDQFIGHFNKAGMLQDFDREFLQRISLYIDDMRILKNICNEYVVYHHRIQSTELDCCKLLSMVVYKNLFPKDINDSQLNKGFISSLFSAKENLIKKEVEILEQEMAQKNHLVIEAKIEFCNDLDELDSLFLNLNTLKIVSVNEQELHSFKSHLDLIRAAKKEEAVVKRKGAQGYAETCDFPAILSDLLKNNEYKQRRSLVERKNSDEIKKLQDECYQLQSRINTLRESRLQGVLTKRNIDSFFSNIEMCNDLGESEKFESVKGNFYFPLLKYLVRNGYIDESYQDYMTYFYENSISRTDKIFLRSVLDEKAKEFSYELKNPELVIGYLKPANFDQPEILNFDLLAYLLQKQDYHRDLLIRLITQLKKSKRLDFVSQFFAKNREAELFVGSLNHYWSSIWKDICSSDFFTSQEQHRYAIFTLHFSSSQDIVHMNEDNCLADYISRNPNFLRIESPSVDKITEKLILLKIQFEEINYDNAHTELLKAVYHHNLYLLNYSMIRLVLNKVYGIPDSKDYDHCNYSLIRSKPNEMLLKYVNSNIVEYFDLLMAWCKSKITDDEATALEILNNQDIDEPRKKQYIEYLCIELDNLGDISEKNLWPTILNYQAVKYSANNILEYFFGQENVIDETLATFINKGSKSIKFSYDAINEKYGQNSASKFFIAVIQCELLSDQKYQKILAELRRVCIKFIYPEMPSSKINILIELGCIQMNNENLEFMRANYPNDLMKFILSNISEYTVNVINENTFMLDELIKILDVPNVNDSNVIKLLSFTREPISILNKYCSENVKIHLLRNNLCIDDIPSLVKNYEQESKSIQTEIELLCCEYVSVLIANNTSLPYILLSFLFASNDISNDIKVKLFINALCELSVTQSKDCFEQLGLREYLELFDGKRPKIGKNSYTEEILSILENNGWISSYKHEEDDPNYFRVIGKKVN